MIKVLNNTNNKQLWMNVSFRAVLIFANV